MAEKRLKVALILSAVDNFTRKIEEGVNRSTRKLQDFQRRADDISRHAMRFGTQAVAMGTAVTGSFFAIAQQAAKYGDDVAKTADRLGVTVEALQEYRHAAELSGMATTQFDSALQQFQKNAGMAAAGLGRARPAFEALGITMTDNQGRMRSMESLLDEVADKMAALEDPTVRGQLAMMIFGSEGSRMVNMLRNGSAGLEAMRQEARDLGIVMSDEAARKAEEFSDNLLRLTKRLTGVRNEAGIALMPMFDEMIVKLGEVSDRVITWVKANPELIQQMGRIAAIAGPIMIGIGGIGIVVGGVAKGLSGLASGVMLAVRAFGFMITVTKTLTALMLANPVTAIVTGIAVAALLIYRYWEPITEFFSQLWDGVTLRFENFVNYVKALGGVFRQAGANIVDSLREGIAAKWDQFTDWWRGRIQSIRDFLPFSPAKVGPLRDIHRIRLVETIADSVRPKPIVDAVRRVAAAAAVSLPLVASPIAAAAVPAQTGAATVQQVVRPGNVQNANSQAMMVTVNYSPTINISGPVTTVQQDEFNAQLRRHKDEIVRIMNEETRRRQVTTF
jgi:hypothetical protein